MFQVHTIKGINYYTCINCGNDWTFKEGFVIKTGKCKGCKEYKGPVKQENKLPEIDFPYIAGDPHW